MEKLFELVYEDLTHLGGSMGTEYTTSRSMGLFKNLDDAMIAAQKDFHPCKHNSGPIVWSDKKGGWRSQDLGYVMYHVNVREVK